jgi:hypothetical protein
MRQLDDVEQTDVALSPLDATHVVAGHPAMMETLTTMSLHTMSVISSAQFHFGMKGWTLRVPSANAPCKQTNEDHCFRFLCVDTRYLALRASARTTANCWG